MFCFCFPFELTSSWRSLMDFLFLFFTDMLQLINNQEMEFGGLFDTHPFSGGTPSQEVSSLSQTINPAAPPATTTTPASSTSSILSSNPHLDALLGPPITRSSSTPDKAFQPPTFQQSPLAQVPSTPQRQQQPSPPPQAQSLKQPQAEQPQVCPSSPAQAASPGPNPALSSSPQAVYASQSPPAPPTPLQPQTPSQNQTIYKIQNNYTGKVYFKRQNRKL